MPLRVNSPKRPVIRRFTLAEPDKQYYHTSDIQARKIFSELITLSIAISSQTKSYP